MASTPIAPGVFAQPRIHGLLANPLRHKVLLETSARPCSPSELAKALGKTLKHISKVVEDLKKAGLVELVEEKPGPKGGIQRYYRATRFILDAADWQELSLPEQATSTATIVGQLQHDQARALVCGTYYSHPHHVVLRDHRQVDDQGMEAIDEIMCRAYDEVVQVSRESLDRCERAGESPMWIVLGLTSFEAAPKDASA